MNTQFIETEKTLTSPFLWQTINIYLRKFSIFTVYFANHKPTISIATLGNNLLLYAHPILNNDINHLSPRSTAFAIGPSRVLAAFYSLLSMCFRLYSSSSIFYADTHHATRYTMYKESSTKHFPTLLYNFPIYEYLLQLKTEKKY